MIIDPPEAQRAILRKKRSRKKKNIDVVRRGSGFDSSFMKDDRVRVRLGPTAYEQGVILAVPTMKKRLFEVQLADRVVDADWFHLAHA